MNTDNIAVVIPALNEAACIADVVRDALKQNACEVVVVDDFSTDGTAERAKQSGATVISLASPLGAWGAAQTGIRLALQKGHSIVLTMDADGQHPADAFKDLIAPIQNGEAHFTIGTCPHAGFAAADCLVDPARFSGLRLADLTSGLGLMTTEHHRWRLGRRRRDYRHGGARFTKALSLYRKRGAGYHAGPSGRAIQNLLSWAKVVFYMAYSACLLSKRGSRNKPPQLLRPQMIPIITSIIGVTVSALILMLIRRSLSVSVGVAGYWSRRFLPFGIAPLVDSLARLLNVAHAPTLAFSLALGTITLKLVYDDVQRSKSQITTKRLVQRLAILETRLRELEGSASSDIGKDVQNQDGKA